MPQLDDPDGRPDPEPVERRVRVVEQDDRRAVEGARQADPSEEAAPVARGPKGGHQVVLAVQPTLDHPVVDGPEVARQLGDERGREQDLRSAVATCQARRADERHEPEPARAGRQPPSESPDPVDDRQVGRALDALVDRRDQ
jgi:hypothetical protein